MFLGHAVVPVMPTQGAECSLLLCPVLRTSVWPLSPSYMCSCHKFPVHPHAPVSLTAVQHVGGSHGLATMAGSAQQQQDLWDAPRGSMSWKHGRGEGCRGLSVVLGNGRRAVSFYCSLRFGCIPRCSSTSHRSQSLPEQ